MAQVESLRTENKFKNTEVGEIPVEWEVASLGDVSYINMGQSPPSETCFDYKNGLPFFQGKAEFGAKYPRVVTWCCSPRKIAEKGDILISVRAPVGDINIAPEKCCIGRGLAAIRGRKAENDFLYFILEFVKGKLVKIGQGSTFEAINKDVLFDLKISLPTIPEQKKIAQILSSIDWAIEKNTEIIERTKQLKKGLMQELLTGKRRVKVGNMKDERGSKFKKTEAGKIPVEWEVTTIGKVAETSSGGTPSRNIEGYFKGTIPWVKSGELEDDLIYDTEEQITESGLQSSSAKLFPKGTLLIALYGATVGKTGILGIDATTNQAICAILCKENSAIAKFLQYYLILKRDQLVAMSSGAAQPNISQEIIQSFSIFLPPKAEQKEIVAILSSVDEKIEREVKEKEKLEQLKKGLMQVLLTGRVRVGGA